MFSYSTVDPAFSWSIQCKMVSATPEIIDIRSLTVIDLKKAIILGLNQSPPTLPTIILYDEAGLKLFEKITYLEEYYLTNCEIAILKRKSDEIVKRLGLKEGGIVVELGSGFIASFPISLLTN
jgi:L-histidine Nalpha-methyltransferase / hercynylcysteine S-oxide synthase